MPGARRTTHPVWRREHAVRVWGPPSGRLSGLGAPPGLASVGWCSGGPPSFCPVSFSLFFSSFRSFFLFLLLFSLFSFLLSSSPLRLQENRVCRNIPPVCALPSRPRGHKEQRAPTKRKRERGKNEKRSHLYRPSELFTNFIHIKAILCLIGAVFKDTFPNVRVYKTKLLTVISPRPLSPPPGRAEQELPTHDTMYAVTKYRYLTLLAIFRTEV